MAPAGRVAAATAKPAGQPTSHKRDDESVADGEVVHFRGEMIASIGGAIDAAHEVVGQAQYGRRGASGRQLRRHQGIGDIGFNNTRQWQTGSVNCDEAPRSGTSNWETGVFAILDLGMASAEPEGGAQASYG